ncbi:MAG: glycosyltransferase family 4 protein [Paludibacteraceae bacterium]|nr:glycosyltransferase family 4 protein [Paludibacteraceae bacterium]MBQ9296172.1 glycosyltransferase family 4 protein [Paludibacteraceae bacterium]
MIKHVLIDGTTISRHMDGLSQYILNIVSRFPKRDDWQYHVVVRPGECPNDYLYRWENQGMLIHTADIAPIGPIREWQFKQWLRSQIPFDAALAPSNQYPMALTIPTIYVVHDIIYERYPGQLGRHAALKRRWLHRNVAHGLKQARYIVAVSQFTKDEILRFHSHVDANKIRVVYEGWEHLQENSGNMIAETPFDEYILYIGSSRGHKNLQGLIDAMALAADSIPDRKGLVIVGDNRMLNDTQREKISELNTKILMTGWLGREQLDAYYRGAKAVVFPSLCEGFGIPVLEAFYYQKPLIVSNTSSLPEVAGEAGVYFSPSKPEEIAQALVNALNMPESERSKWIQKGTRRLHDFSWQKTADEIGQLLANLLNG